MRLLSVSLGNRRGDLELIGKVDIANKEVKFQLIVNNLLVCESEAYDEVREVMLDVMALNTPDREGMN